MADQFTKYNRSRINNNQIDELIGLCHGLVADGKINQDEAEYLQKWLFARQAGCDNPILANLLEHVSRMLHDSVLDHEEAQELLEVLKTYTGGDFDLGEMIKASPVFADNPQPSIVIPNNDFCFTGRFMFGSQGDCEQAVIERGGRAGRLTLSTNFLVVGTYSNENWKHASCGTKILRAQELKASRHPISIVTEHHWQKYL